MSSRKLLKVVWPRNGHAASLRVKKTYGVNASFIGGRRGGPFASGSIRSHGRARQSQVHNRSRLAWIILLKKNTTKRYCNSLYIIKINFRAESYGGLLASPNWRFINNYENESNSQNAWMISCLNLASIKKWNEKKYTKKPLYVELYIAK